MTCAISGAVGSYANVDPRVEAMVAQRFGLRCEPVSTPKFYAAAKVYTVEFFDSVRRSLASDGVYATWFSPSDTSPEGVSFD